MELTREEQYLAYLSGTGTALPEPITRNERYLYNLCKNGTGGAKTWSDLGESPTGGDTLEWDGNTEGKTVIDMSDTVDRIFFKVSDATPTEDDFTNGATGIFQPDGIEVPIDIFIPFADGCYFLSDLFALVIPTDNFSAENEEVGLTITAAEKGVYFAKSDGVAFYSSLTIPNFTGFPSVNKVPEEYLPGANILVADSEKYLYKEGADTTDTTQRLTASELKNIFRSGMPTWLVLSEDLYEDWFAVNSGGFEGGVGFLTVLTLNVTFYTAEYTA